LAERLLPKQKVAGSNPVSRSTSPVARDRWPGRTVWETPLFPKDGRYVATVKAVIRKAVSLAEGDTATLELTMHA
jgi:hypothetical protein